MPHLASLISTCIQEDMHMLGAAGDTSVNRNVQGLSTLKKKKTKSTKITASEISIQAGFICFWLLKLHTRFKKADWYKLSLSLHNYSLHNSFYISFL